MAPEFNFVEVATRYARKFLGLDVENMEQTLKQLFNPLLDVGRVLLTLPRSLEQVIRRLEAGQIEVKLASNGQSKWIRGRGRDNDASSGVGSFTWLFMFVASLGGGIFLLTNTHQFIAGWFCFGLAGLITLGVLMKS